MILLKKNIALLSIGALLSCLAPVHIHAEENPSPKKNFIIEQSASGRKLYGSSYWTSSNIREWLNSDAKNVQFTNQPPTSAKIKNFSYDKESGFLHSFSKEEYDAIAITKHRVNVTGFDKKSGVHDGGDLKLPLLRYYNPSITFSQSGLVINHDKYYYKYENDKVFLLNVYEIYNYLQKRGTPLRKNISNEAKQKRNYYEDSIEWYTSSGGEDVGSEALITIDGITDASVRRRNANNSKGIVPAIHLKPEYKLNNGMMAKDLKIGDVLNFGIYNDVPIKWKVINKTEDGYPLLLSEEILDIKPFDTQGDESYAYSDTVNFNKEDVSVIDETYTPNENQKDVQPPIIELLNKELINQTQKGEFTLDFKVTDNESGLDYIQLPNGNKVKSSSFKYTVSENTEYLFIAKDKSGNHRYYTVPVGNINTPSKVLVKSSGNANGWTNKDVKVDISASNQVGLHTSYTQDYRSKYHPIWETYTTYKGKRIKVSGTVELLNATESVDKINAQIGYAYASNKEYDSEYSLVKTWVIPKVIPLKTLKEQGKQTFEFISTVPNDYHSNFEPYTGMNIDVYKKDYKIKWTDLKFELLDDDDFKINKIELPNGKDKLDSVYTDTLSKEGVYTYKVHDNRGMVTEKSIEVKIDKTSPTIEFEQSQTEWTNTDINIKVKTSDAQSGIDYTILPNESKVEKDIFDFKVYENGTYTFEVHDKAGNVTKKVLEIKNIDKEAPTFSTQENYIYENGKYDKTRRVITVIGKDNDSGMDSIQLPSGEWVKGDNATFTVSENGRYPFKLKDKAGNINSTSINITEIEKLSISGIQKIEYKLDGAETKGWTNYSEPFFVRKEGLTTITSRTYDKAGNVSKESTRMVKLDKTKPVNNQILIELK